MHIGMYEKFLAPAFALETTEREGDFVRSGRLTHRQTGRCAAISGFIPRLCREDYCRTFSFQWARFKNIQLDSRNGRELSRRRLLDNTHWTMDELRGKTVIECGCGPGRFTEIFLGAGADVVAVDMSLSIDVNLENNGLRDNLLLIQADIADLPFFENRFDFVFCYGVLQHTPDPAAAFRAIAGYLRHPGKISVDVYRKMDRPSPWSTPKYFWRPLTKRLKPETLLSVLSWYLPKYIDIDTRVRSTPRVGEILAGLIPIPCWNYLHNGYTREERIQHAIMDTFDALSPAHDHPQSAAQVRAWFDALAGLEGAEVFYGSNGLVGNALTRRPVPERGGEDG